MSGDMEGETVETYLEMDHEKAVTTLFEKLTIAREQAKAKETEADGLANRLRNLMAHSDQQQNDIELERMVRDTERLQSKAEKKQQELVMMRELNQYRSENERLKQELEKLKAVQGESPQSLPSVREVVDFAVPRPSQVNPHKRPRSEKSDAEIAIQRVSEFLMKHGIKQHKLARLVGCSQGTLSSWLKHKYGGDVHRITQRVNVALDKFADKEDDELKQLIDAIPEASAASNTQHTPIKRKNFTRGQVEQMESIAKNNPNPGTLVTEQLSKSFNRETRHIVKWFSNWRSRKQPKAEKNAAQLQRNNQQQHQQQPAQQQPSQQQHHQPQQQQPIFSQLQHQQREQRPAQEILHHVLQDQPQQQWPAVVAAISSFLPQQQQQQQQPQQPPPSSSINGMLTNDSLNEQQKQHNLAQEATQQQQVGQEVEKEDLEGQFVAGEESPQLQAPPPPTPLASSQPIQLVPQDQPQRQQQDQAPPSLSMGLIGMDERAALLQQRQLILDQHANVLQNVDLQRPCIPDIQQAQQQEQQQQQQQEQQQQPMMLVQMPPQGEQVEFCQQLHQLQQLPQPPPLMLIQTQSEETGAPQQVQMPQQLSSQQVQQLSQQIMSQQIPQSQMQPVLLSDAPQQTE